jgi:hypothetical protein
MKGMTLRQAVAALFFLFPSALCLAQSPSDGPVPPDSSRQFGLVFDVQAAPHFSSISSFATGGYSISLGFGLNFSPMFQISIQVYTGREEFPAGSVRPVDGWLPLGGASLEGTLFLASGPALRPYGTAGYGLYTIAGENGYNGGGPHFEAGVEWDLSRYFSIRGGVQYTIIWFHDPTGEASQAAGFEPFTAHFLGSAIRCAFYPSVLP